MEENTNLARPYWALSAEEIAGEFNSDLKNGLTLNQAEEILKKSGQNEFGKTKKFSKFKILFQQFHSPLIFILIVAGLATLFLEEWFDTGIIFLAIGVNTFLGFYQENKAENALENLRSYIKDRVRVIRDGNEIEIDVSNVVVGDLIHMAGGNRVPADAVIIHQNNLKVNESILTGESLDINKNTEILPEETLLPERKNMIFGGTAVTEGSGLAMVVATGDDTEIGKIANLVSETQHTKTPLQKAVIKLSWIITFAISFVVVGVFALGVSRGESFFDMFLMSVAVAVGAIPEALPIGLTAVLSVGVQQLAKRKGIMRNLAAAETLGSTSVIMTDKTGTLTEANMQLVDILMVDEILDGLSEREQTNEFSQRQKELLILSAMNTDVLVENPNDNPNDWRMNGNALEGNIIKSAAQHNLNVKEFKNKSDFGIVLPFNSKNKFSVSEGNIRSNQEILAGKEGRVQVILGAPDILVQRSNLSEKDFGLLGEKIEKLSYSGNRVLGVAIKIIPDSSNYEFEGSEIKDFEMIGFLAFKDPVRKTVPAAIQKMNDYGIRVVMATGDMKGTAVSVGKEIGWEIEDKDVLSGEEIRNMSDEELKISLDYVQIFARVTPEDKLRIGRLYQERGEIVAMTGDGVNDAPSLKAVDIGIAVGSGTDVAKDVADLVLLDNNFETIVSAIDEGKLMLKNIRKIFVYLMSNSLDEVILIGGSLLASLALPLTAIQIIWVNFFTGSFPAIAFAFDKEDVFKGNIVKNDRKILNGEVKFLIVGIGILNSMLMFGIYWYLMSRTNFRPEVIQTFLFACFSSYILFVAFSLRNLERSIMRYNILSNKILVAGIVTGMILLSLTIYVPFLQVVFQTVSLSFGWVMLVALWVLANMIMVELAKWFFYSKLLTK